jgi:Flp pilus assembly protein TadG
MRMTEQAGGVTTPGKRRHNQRGAEAVEFALITVVLFPLLFGIIQYGFFFNDFLQARQAVRLGARTAVVLTTPACGGNAANSALAIKCNTTNQASPVSGAVSTYVAAPNGWNVGQPMLVCQAVKTVNIIGILPLPNSGYALAKTQMTIEQDTSTGATNPTGTFPANDTDPTGKSWSWCTS